MAYESFPFGVESTRGLNTDKRCFTTFGRNALDLREERLRGELDELHAFKKAIAYYGDDDFEEGAVLRFDKVLDRSNPNATAYQYCAMKCVNGYWYTTGPVNGRGNSPWTWDELTTWMAKGFPVTQVWVFTEMTPLEALK